MKSKKPTLVNFDPEIIKRTIEIRRDVHKHPELQYEEKRTQKVIIEELKHHGIRGEKIGGTGVWALIGGTEGKLKDKVLMLRADMDALPVHEEADVEWKSIYPGKMHACGHDAHTAMLLGVAAVLKRKPLEGPVKLCFQPAEEAGIGAQGMIDDGILDNPPVSGAFALHVWSGFPTGKMAVMFGPCMAAVDEFTLVVKGVAGHAAFPNLSVDPVYISAQIISTLQSVVSRNISPIESAVVSVSSIHAGEGFNIIPPAVTMKGTCRSFSDETRKLIKKRFREITKGVTESLGGSVEIEYRWMTPAVINDQKMAEIMWQAGVDILGKRNMVKAPPVMGGEDMSLYMRKVPGCFGFIGMQDKKTGSVWPHHHPKFSVDEACMPLGMEILYRAAEIYFSNL